MSSMITMYTNIEGRAGFCQPHLKALNMLVKRWYRTVSTRRDLTELSTEQLSDVGITQEEASEEAARLPWDFNR